MDLWMEEMDDYAVAMEAYGEQHRRQIEEEANIRKKLNIEHNKMFAKMFMKKIGVRDVQFSDLDIHIIEKYYIVKFSIIAEINFDLHISVFVNGSYNHHAYTVYLCSDNLSYSLDRGFINTRGDKDILNDKPKSKLLYEYIANDNNSEIIKQIIRDLYNLIYLTDYKQNLPKAYTFLLCCPGTIPKGVDKIITKKILFFKN